MTPLGFWDDTPTRSYGYALMWGCSYRGFKIISIWTFWDADSAWSADLTAAQG